jgi:plasmid stability protein
MTGFAINRFPDELHHSLKERARQHHRSMTQEALSILEKGLLESEPPRLPPLRKGKFPLTEEWLHRAKRAGLE